MLKLTDNPPLQPPSLPDLLTAQGPWWVAHTKARQEKALAWDLLAKGVGYYLPMLERTTFSGGRKRRGMTPLFPGYLFFTGDRDARHAALSTNRVANVIPVEEEATLARELHAIDLAIADGMALDYRPDFQVGQRCRITQGPMKDTLGLVLEAGDVSRIVLQVSMLGVGAALEINGDLLEILE